MTTTQHDISKAGYRRNLVLNGGIIQFGKFIDIQNIQSKKMGYPNKVMPDDYIAIEICSSKNPHSGIVRHEKKNRKWIS